jgi:hypothetical protein
MVTLSDFRAHVSYLIRHRLPVHGSDATSSGCFRQPRWRLLGSGCEKDFDVADIQEGGMMVTEALLAPFWAKVGPKVGKFRCIQIGSVCSVTAVIVMGFCSSPWQVILCRFCSESIWRLR